MFEHHHVCINGLRTHVVTAGDGEEPIVFLHGFPEYWGVWKAPMQALAQTHRVLAPDLRGAGQTQRPLKVEAYGIDHLVGDVRELLDHFDIERATLVGQGWGGVVAWSFLLRHPDWVSRLVVMGVTHPVLLDRALRRDPAQAGPLVLELGHRGEERLADDEAFVDRAVLEDIRAHGGALSAEDEQEWRAWLRDRDHLRAGINWYRAARIGPPSGPRSEAERSLVEGLSEARLRVSAPVLVLSSLGDPYFSPASLEGLEEFVEDLTLERIEGTTHWLTLQRPQRVTETIREFLARR